MIAYVVITAAYIVLTGDYPGAGACLGLDEDSIVIATLLALHY